MAQCSLADRIRKQIVMNDDGWSKERKILLNFFVNPEVRVWTKTYALRWNVNSKANIISRMILPSWMKEKLRERKFSDDEALQKQISWKENVQGKVHSIHIKQQKLKFRVYSRTKERMVVGAFSIGCCLFQNWIKHVISTPICGKRNELLFS